MYPPLRYSLARSFCVSLMSFHCDCHRSRDLRRRPRVGDRCAALPLTVFIGLYRLRLGHTCLRGPPFFCCVAAVEGGGGGTEWLLCLDDRGRRISRAFVYVMLLLLLLLALLLLLIFVVVDFCCFRFLLWLLVAGLRRFDVGRLSSRRRLGLACCYCLCYCGCGAGVGVPCLLGLLLPVSPSVSFLVWFLRVVRHLSFVVSKFQELGV